MTHELTVYSCRADEEALFRSRAAREKVSLRVIHSPLTPESAGLARGAVSVSHLDRVDAPLLAQLREMGVPALSTRSVGLDHIDRKAAGTLGLPVFNTPYSPEGVADYALLLMLSALRGAREIWDRARRGDFRPPALRAKELHEMTVGVVGAGRIGRAVIARLRGFGCRVLISDPNAEASQKAIPLEDLLRLSDLVTLHLPLLPETLHLLGPREFARMRPGAILVNTARGGLVDSMALLEGLEKNRPGFAALDVLEEEAGLFSRDAGGEALPDALGALLNHPRALVSPHIAYHTLPVLEDTVNWAIDIACQAEGRKEKWIV